MHWLPIALCVLLSGICIWYDVARDRPVGRWGLMLTIFGAIAVFLWVWFAWPGLFDLVLARR